jgi:hypothetical protein
MKRLTLAFTVLALSIRLNAAIPDSFRAEVNKSFPKRSVTVIVKEKLPTTSVLGFNGEHTDAYASVDIGADSSWKLSEDRSSSYQRPLDTLSLGEVMRLVDVTYKENRLDLRLVSLDTHKIGRGKGIFRQYSQEEVSTNLRFAIAHEDLSDPSAVIQRVESYLRPFPAESEARAFGKALVPSSPSPEPSPSAPTASAEPAPTPTLAPPQLPPTPSAPTDLAAPAQPASGGPHSVKKQIHQGMTFDEVRAELGEPDQEVVFEKKVRWSYPGMTVIFQAGKVVDVRF